MNRREVIQAILAAAVGGAALSSSVKAGAKMFGYDRYARLITLQKQVISMNRRAKDAGMTGPALRDIISPVVDRVFGYAMDNFDGDLKAPEALQATREIFAAGRACNTLDLDYLHGLLETVVPIAVARYLLANERLSFAPLHMGNWERFVDRYKDVILAS